MNYIVHKRFKGNTVSGQVNLPAMTVCRCENGVITHNGRIICAAWSEVSHQHFAINDDGMGIARGKLIRAIQNTLARRDAHYQDRWDLVWEDPVCLPYKAGSENFWRWNEDFYTAEIGVLRHIAEMIGAKEDA